jgi:tetratricopeptide (TPR) repeat protein
MDNRESYSEKLIQYMDGELTGHELEIFEKLLSENSELQEELKNLELAKAAISSYGLKSQVASVHREMMQEFKEHKMPAGSKIYPFIRDTLKYAASIVLILFSIGIYMYATTSSSKIYKENYEPYKLSISRGENTNTDIEQAFNTCKYDIVISTFKSFAHPDIKAYFLVAQAYLSTHQSDKAIPAFNQVVNSPGSNSFKDDASYYLALTYIENNQPAKALPIFEKIHADRDHLYHDRVSYWTLLKLKLLAFKSSEK